MYDASAVTSSYPGSGRRVENCVGVKGGYSPDIVFWDWCGVHGPSQDGISLEQVCLKASLGQLAGIPTPGAPERYVPHVSGMPNGNAPLITWLLLTRSRLMRTWPTKALPFKASRSACLILFHLLAAERGGGVLQERGEY